MRKPIDRREFLKLAGLGGVVFASGFRGCARQRAARRARRRRFLFRAALRHALGLQGAPNPEAKRHAEEGGRGGQRLAEPPDFIVFTGDLTHTTDDPGERRKRLAEFKDIVGELKVKDVRFMPGEHDASLDRGEAYQEFFGETHYTFDHKGVHFIALDNVSDPAARDRRRAARVARGGSRKQPQTTRTSSCFTHRPLFDLYPQWDWATRDGAQGDRPPDAAPQRHGVLRPHPPGAPPHDRAHRASRGEGR